MNHPHPSALPAAELPSSLQALRVLFFVFGGLGLLISVIGSGGLSAPDDQIRPLADEAGMTVDGLRAFMTYGVLEGFVFAIAYLIFGAMIRNGGVVLRNIMVGTLLVSLAGSIASLVFFPQFFLMEGQAFGTVLGTAIVAVMLGLAVTERSRDHFTVNTRPTPSQ